MWCNWPCFEQNTEPDGLQRSLPVKIILQFCDSVRTSVYKIIDNCSGDKLKAKLPCELS